MTSQKTTQQRFLSYLVLFGLCCIVPYITTMLFVAVTNHRELGMSLAVIPSVILVHFVFPTFFLQTRSSIKFSASIVNTTIAIIGLKYVLPLNLIHNLFDMYGFWDFAITHSLIAIIIWEITYQVLTKPSRKK